MDSSLDICKYFYNGGLNCAESVLRILIETGRINISPECVRMMTGFGGGMQRGSICGCVTAAVAALGSIYGRSDPGESRTLSSAAVKKFLAYFEDRFDSIHCSELQKSYVKEHALKSEGMYRACTVFVGTAIELFDKVCSEMNVSAELNQSGQTAEK